MIYLYSGTPGSGKSLHSASVIKMNLKMNRPVICNFPIVEDVKGYKNFTYCPNWNLTPDYLIKFSQEHFKGKRIKEDSIILIIDECQLLFNARDWQQCGRNKWLSFYTQHRHYGYLIILVAQFDRMIDRQIRSLIEYNFLHRKVANMGWKGFILNMLLGGKSFVCVKVWYPLNEKVGSEIFKARKSLYSIYDSYNILSVEDETKKPKTAVTVTVTEPDTPEAGGEGVPADGVPEAEKVADHRLLIGGLKIHIKNAINLVIHWLQR